MCPEGDHMYSVVFHLLRLEQREREQQTGRQAGSENVEQIERERGREER